MSYFVNKEFRTALAACNLINAGFSGESVLQELTKWVSTMAYVTDHFREYLQDISTIPLEVNGNPHLLDRGTLYLSFHQFPYQLIYRLLKSVKPDDTINILSGKSPDIVIAQYCEAIRTSLGSNLRFIQSSPKVIREVRAALRKEPVVTYIDSPWKNATSGDFDLSYAVERGRFRSYSTFERLIKLVAEDYQFVLVSGDPRTSPKLTFASELSFEAMYSFVAQQIFAEPGYFQNLDKFHEHFVFDCPRNWIVSFELNFERYAIRTATMCLYKLRGLVRKIPPGPAVLTGTSEVGRLFEQALKQEAEFVLLL